MSSASMAAVLGGLFVALLDAQPATIPDSMARGSTGRITSEPSGAPPTIDALLAETELVVRGRVGALHSYLSEDRMEVLTDVSILAPVILFDIKPTQSPPIQQLNEMVMTQLGGTITVGVQRFEQKELGLPLLEQGSDVLLLLQRARGKLMPARTYYGAFSIESAALRPLSAKRQFAAQYRGAPVDAVTQDLLVRIAQVHGQGVLSPPR